MGPTLILVLVQFKTLDEGLLTILIANLILISQVKTGYSYSFTRT